MSQLNLVSLGILVAVSIFKNKGECYSRKVDTNNLLA